MSKKDIFLTESESFDLRGALNKYQRYWYLFVATILLSLAGAYTYMRYSTPQYLISSTLLIQDNNKGASVYENSFFNELGIFQTNQSINDEIELLKSITLLQRVVKDLSLYVNYYVEGNIKTEEIYGSSLPIKVVVSDLKPQSFAKTLRVQIKDKNTFILNDEETETSHEFGQKIVMPYATFTITATPGFADNGYNEVLVKFKDYRRVANYYSSALSIYPISKETKVIAINLADPVPEKGIDIVYHLIALYNKEKANDKNASAVNSLNFLDERINFLSGELTDVEENVERYKRNNEVTNIDSDARMYVEKAADYNRQISEWEVQIDVLQTIEDYLTKSENKSILVPSTLNIKDPTLQDLINRFNELQLERQGLLRTMQPNNPLVANLSDQLSNLEVNILENIRNIKQGLIITRNNLQKSYAQFQTKKQLVPSIERDLLEINRQQGTKEGLYLYLLQKREESALSLAADVSNIKIIDEAMVSLDPIKPVKKLVYLVAIILGFVLPVAFIFLKDQLNHSIQHKKDVENVTETPILGELAHNSNKESLVVTDMNRTSVAESFRLIRANLQFATVGGENRVILITSSMSGEGKTFFSLNLAASLVLTGKRVIVLDFDLRKPKLMQYMGIKHEKGITNYLISETPSIDEIVVQLPQIPDLFLVGSGPIPPNPSELMLHPRVDKLIEDLKAVFDYVIIDTSPIGQVSDALALSPYIDSSIYIVRYNYTAKEQIEIIDDIYRSRKLKFPMIVLNDAKKQNGYGYGYGYGYRNKDWDGKFMKKAKV
ncbi:polysaccharide biosynthesis tyrosine autokinase [Pontibacter sp. BT731]|uniref:GumC family protein n=1 Tax=Pontibacter coccineus TaxID=3063328 RepID=UPI0026E43742|nr:tyrosine-protein kinase [Pontibacter sp. BT731]MDO6390992.1 polysaccharide biosynthesis tyrosine autokinase [Pontibacter sp. BT731]